MQKKNKNIKNVMVVTIFGKDNRLVKLMTKDQANKYKIINPLAEVTSINTYKNVEDFIKLFTTVYGSNAINGWYDISLYKIVQDTNCFKTMLKKANIGLINAQYLIDNNIYPNMEQELYLNKITITEKVYDCYSPKFKTTTSFVIKEDIKELVKKYTL